MSIPLEESEYSTEDCPGRLGLAILCSSQQHSKRANVEHRGFRVHAKRGRLDGG